MEWGRGEGKTGGSRLVFVKRQGGCLAFLPYTMLAFDQEPGLQPGLFIPAIPARRRLRHKAQGSGIRGQPELYKTLS